MLAYVAPAEPNSYSARIFLAQFIHGIKTANFTIQPSNTDWPNFAQTKKMESMSRGMPGKHTCISSNAMITEAKFR
jgi:hypothetical protein